MIEHLKEVDCWRVVPNGVPLKSYSFRRDVAVNAPLVFLGRIEEVKGPHLAIEVAKRSGRKLLIAGNVPDDQRRWVEARVFPHIDGEQIRYAGPVDDAQKNDLLGIGAALLMPILWQEPFGIVMTEAMACGTPVLGLRRGSVPEVIVDGVTGFVADTVDELVAAVGKLPQLNRHDCRKHVEAYFSEDKIVSTYESLYWERLEQANSTSCR